jgi:hypothetical protein
MGCTNKGITDTDIVSEKGGLITSNGARKDLLNRIHGVSLD